jgi:Pyruvate/2-oxoacid:ferredoxin oxidoreductase delta subunit
MKFELKYFTGTGNSLKVLNTCKEVFVANNHVAEVSAISVGQQLSEDVDVIGFCFPVYAFGIPRICRQYLKKLDRFKKQQKVFVLITAGDADEAGLAFRNCERILAKKNCVVVYSAVVQMPINWIVFEKAPSEKEAEAIIKKGVELTSLAANDMLNGVQKFHQFNYPKRYSKFGFYKEYYLFKYLGIYNLWRMFKTYDSCNGCQLCSKICPTRSVVMVNNRPTWTSSCEQCMRCVNFCPKGAIYQTYGGDTLGKIRYFEPSFKPLKEV